MSHASYLYDASNTELYRTDGYGGGDTDIDDTERFTSTINMTVETGAAIQIKFDASGATDDLILSLYKSIDADEDDDWDGDEIAVESITVGSDSSEDLYVYDILDDKGAGYFRLGLKSSGSNDTFEVDVQMRQWRRTDTSA